MKLENVVPWGRSLTEYQAMFALSEEDLQKRILRCGDGPREFQRRNDVLWKANGNFRRSALCFERPGHRAIVELRAFFCGTKIE
jgi:hypothetical protein